MSIGQVSGTREATTSRYPSETAEAGLIGAAMGLGCRSVVDLFVPIMNGRRIDRCRLQDSRWLSALPAYLGAKLAMTIYNLCVPGS
jgi:hypothetical protein